MPNQGKRGFKPAKKKSTSAHRSDKARGFAPAQGSANGRHPGSKNSAFKGQGANGPVAKNKGLYPNKHGETTSYRVPRSGRGGDASAESDHTVSQWYGSAQASASAPRAKNRWTKQRRDSRDQFQGRSDGEQHRSKPRAGQQWAEQSEPARRQRPQKQRAARSEYDSRPDYSQRVTRSSRNDCNPRRSDNSCPGRSQRPEDNDTADVMSWDPTVTDSFQSSTDNHVSTVSGFGELGVPGALVSVLTSRGIDSPFPIQAATIPDAMAGRDLLGRGQTGSGKTLAYALPMITRLQGEGPRHAPGGLVLAPTRELAMQVADVVSSLASAVGLRTVLVAGGMSYEPQLRAMRRGVDIVVATPGRLIDLLQQGAANLGEVRVVVLDEADEMADMGFLPDVSRIMDAVPTQAQHLLFSATLDHGVDKVVAKYLHHPVVHGVDSGKATVATMRHQVWQIGPADKATVIAQVAGRKGRTVVFVRTQRGADRVAAQLREQGVLAGPLHGGLTQGARARVLAAFKGGRLPVLVATDVAARGIHVDGISLVLQADIPHDAKDYLHRAGRTARAGEKGLVVSLVLPQERRAMARIAREAGLKAEPVRVRPLDDTIAAAGGIEPTGEAISDAAYQELVAPPVMRRARSSRGKRGWRPRADRAA